MQCAFCVDYANVVQYCPHGSRTLEGKGQIILRIDFW